MPLQAIDTGRREYRMRGWQRGFYLVLGLAINGIGIWGAWAVSKQTHQASSVLLILVPLVLGLYLLATALRSRLVIDGTRIEVRGAFREQTADMSEVEGFRTISTRNGSFWRLKLKEGRGSITIQKWFDCDDLRAWFQQLTDLDERDRKALLNEIEQNQELGATTEDRLAALKRAKQWNIGLTATAIAAALAFNFAGGSLRLTAALVLALVPAVVLYLLHREPLLFAVGKSKRDPRAELSIAFLAAGFGLFFGGIGVHFVSLKPLLELTVAVVLACALAFAAIGGKGPRQQGFVVVVLMYAVFYSYGLVEAGDTLFDHVKTANYTTMVIGRHAVHGRSTTYYLDLGPWGPFDGENKFRVPLSQYRAANTGDAVCLELHPGSLHAAWYERVGCEAAQDVPPVR
jgi:hypothetical protein